MSHPRIDIDTLTFFVDLRYDTFTVNGRHVADGQQCSWILTLHQIVITHLYCRFVRRRARYVFVDLYDGWDRWRIWVWVRIWVRIWVWVRVWVRIWCRIYGWRGNGSR